MNSFKNITSKFVDTSKGGSSSSFCLMLCLIYFASQIVGCSPVRSGNTDFDRSPLTDKNMKVADTLQTGVGTNYGTPQGQGLSNGNSFNPDQTHPSSDTLIVLLNPLIAKSASQYQNSGDKDNQEFESVELQLKNISDMLDNGMIDQACPLANSLWQEEAGNNEQKWHARFLIGECQVAKNELNQAKSIFLEVMESSAKMEAREKATIRLGQIYCITGDHDNAKYYFKMLKTEFPNSKYIALAEC